jgi:gamma-glutamyltranspeptidase
MAIDDEENLHRPDNKPKYFKKGTGYLPLAVQSPLQIEYDSEKSSEKSNPGFAMSSEDHSRKLRRHKFIFLGVVLPLLIIIVALSIVIASRSTSGTSSTTSSSSGSSEWDQFYVKSSKGAVATDIQLCSQIGVNALMEGGNAIDAAIAAKFCLGVVSPASSGIGGGCYILLHDGGSQEDEFIDAREIAPKLAFPKMFKENPISAQDGGLAIAVLGEVKGLYLAYQRHGSGKISWENLVKPAVELAKEWIITPEIHKLFFQVEKQLYSGNFPLLSSLYMKQDSKTGKLMMKEAGDVVKQPELAHTLERIGKEGPSYLYGASMAEILSREIKEAGGIVSMEDIVNYEPVITKPITANFSGYTYLGVGGSSSGGPIVVGLLKYLASLSRPLVSLSKVSYNHYLIEGMKHMFAIRTNLGDPDYVNVTAIYDALVSDEYQHYLQNVLTKPYSTQPLTTYGGRYNINYLPKEDHGTSHLCVLDSQGNGVALTSTINTYFGSKVISPTTGILFNNQMDDFAIPGAANYFGLAPSPYNYPEPFKKPLSSMSPSIVLDDQRRVRLIGGGSGGPKIITATAQVKKKKSKINFFKH